MSPCYLGIFMNIWVVEVVHWLILFSMLQVVCNDWLIFLETRVLVLIVSETVTAMENICAKAFRHIVAKH